VEGSHIPLQPDRTSKVFDGRPVLALLVSHHAKKMNRVGVIRFRLQDLPVDLLGGLQPTGLMVLDRDGQALRESLP
jgi:hypothetical protein